jgi:hypothetical protein
MKFDPIQYAMYTYKKGKVQTKRGKNKNWQSVDLLLLASFGFGHDITLPSTDKIYLGGHFSLRED